MGSISMAHGLHVAVGPEAVSADSLVSSGGKPPDLSACVSRQHPHEPGSKFLIRRLYRDSVGSLLKG